MILVRIDGVVGDSQIEGFKEYFTAESFGFSVERDLADSSKAGTADVNIGVGELQECTISKSMDSASAFLAKKAISGSSCGTADIKFVETITRDKDAMFNIVYLAYKLDNVFIKSWSTSGDADDRPTEDVALWYNKIAFCYFTTEDGKTFKFAGDCRWDQVKSKPWSEAKLPTAAEEHKASA
ncbi:MAG: type VI secretion system tube protein Hcp [Pirellulaceae bacterium]|nr:type VI secretion system tube protein Hcp [Pirellulaceae bacterium]